MKKFIYHFIFSPAHPRPLAVLRILLALTLLGQAFSLSTDLVSLYSREGLLQGTLADYMRGLALPSMGWLENTFAQYSVASSTTVHAVFILYVASLVSLLLGWYTRVSTIICWLTHFLVIVSEFVFVYGVDHFANIFLFFLIWMPSGNDLSMDNLQGRTLDAPTPGTRLALRVLQFELCVIYFSSGVHKALGEQWWNGEAIWRATNLPLFGLVDMYWLAHFEWLAVLSGWVTLLIETGYPFLIFPQKTRKLWVALTILLHVGIAITIGLFSFSIMMAILTFSLFGISYESKKG